MEANRRFTIMTFPQHFDGINKLRVNILFIPRSQNPLKAAIENKPTITVAVPSFAKARLEFNAVWLKGLDKFPNNLNGTTLPVTGAAVPAGKENLFVTLAGEAHFNIEQKDDSNENLVEKMPAPKPVADTVKKYLPVTYQKAFNFIAPKLKTNAFTDDTYHCAVKKAKRDPLFKQSPDTVTWGKVFAHVLRNPLLAREAGFIYTVDMEINLADFEDGGYLHIDLANGSDYREALNQDFTFIKKYAARIPALRSGEERPLFAANLFPVLFKASGAVVDPPAPGNFDEVFIEAAEYDDGFGKILHSFQSPSQYLLNEESDGFHPTHDAGIRLAWDDEQILQWYVRQMAEDPSAGAGNRLDAPTGVIGYHIDVRESGKTGWDTLNQVKTLPGVDALGGLTGNAASFEGELPYQVYPSTLDGTTPKTYWLPMYFANWNGNSMVLPDKYAIAVYQLEKGLQPNPRTNVTGSPKNEMLKVYEPTGLNTLLRYGHHYDFQIRFCDLTHGGPTPGQSPFNDGLHPITNCHFKRYVAPAVIKADDVPFNEDGAVYSKPSLKFKRPLLGYPAVVYTGAYTNPVQKIISKVEARLASGTVGNEAELSEIGLEDPNVEGVEIIVEVQALKMDYRNSLSGKESFAELYRTYRKFKPIATEDDYQAVLEVPLTYLDVNVLKVDDKLQPFGAGVYEKTQIDAAVEIPIPRARAVRLTVRAVCEERSGYYGLEDTNPTYNTRFGRTRLISLYQPSLKEIDLYQDKLIQAIYLQPDEIPLEKPLKIQKAKIMVSAVKTPDSVQRLAQQLNVENTGLHLVGRKGERIQFGCSARIRHTLAPDNSAVTFASKEELYNHWLCCISLDLNRDWTWDALEDLSFEITRKKWFRKQPEKIYEEVVGEIEIKKSISFNALQKADREYTKIIFIDAVEPKKSSADANPTIPDEIELSYSVKPVFKTGHAVEEKEAPLQFNDLKLPVTEGPMQIPKIASAGIALSPYYRSAKYSSTEPRQRFLWIEFEEAVKSDNDIYFGRVVAYAPDQLISNNNPGLEEPQPEPPLNLDPEYIRVVSQNQSDDNAGINAMQPLEKSMHSDKHYLLPLPEGLNESSAELFGFFTYEFRVGHASIWSTAQGRFGRPLKATGIQHPAPTLSISVSRDSELLYASASYATAVFNGRNVTANPPRTQLWCLLYAQVKQADKNDAEKPLKDYRNILLEDRLMYRNVNLDKFRKKIVKPQKESVPKIDIGIFTEGPKITMMEEKTNVMEIVEKPTIQEIEQSYLNTALVQNSDGQKYATAVWTREEVEKLLNEYGLPTDLPLSVLCVEVFSNITNRQEYRTPPQWQPEFTGDVATGKMETGDFGSLTNREAYLASYNAVRSGAPLTKDLGSARILRTSPLLEVPPIC